jgi:hypothetical protein
MRITAASLISISIRGSIPVMRAPDRTEALLTLFHEGQIAEFRQMASSNGLAKSIDQARRRYRRSGAARQQALSLMLRRLILDAEAASARTAREALSPEALAERDQFVRSEISFALQDTIDRRVLPALAKTPRFIQEEILLAAIDGILSSAVTFFDWIRSERSGYRTEFYGQQDERSW